MPESPSPSPTFDVDAWRAGLELWTVEVADQVEVGLDLARLGIFALVMLGGIIAALTLAIVFLGIRRGG